MTKETVNIKVSGKLLDWLEDRLENTGSCAELSEVKQWRGKEVPVEEIKLMSERIPLLFGFFFLDEPPGEIEEIRAVLAPHGLEVRDISPALEETMREVLEHQTRQSGRRGRLGIGALSVTKAMRGKSSVKEYRKTFAETLELPENFLRLNNLSRYALIRQALSDNGVVVIEKPFVPEMPEHILSSSECAGFCFYDPYAPVIFINTADGIDGALQTLVFLAFRIMSGASGAVLGEISDRRLERAVNAVTKPPH